MRFVCDSCRAQYMISDDKVGPKGVKVRCKKCGYVILVRKTQDAAPAPAPAFDEEERDATQVMQNPLANLGASLDQELTNPGGDKAAAEAKARDNLLGASEDEIGAVFDSVLNSGSHKVADPDANEGTPTQGGAALGDEQDDRLSTRVLDADTMRKLAEEAGAGAAHAPSANGAEKNGKHEEKNGQDYDWYVAIDEKQVGPLKKEAVKEKWDAGEIGPDSLCWRAGIADWIPLSEAAELASVLAPRPQKPIIVSNPGASAPSVVSVPVESAFSSGGVTRTVRSEVQVPMAAAGASEEPSGWKPSAASALASLVKEEIDALTKPAETRLPMNGEGATALATGSLLDLPPADEPRSNGQPAASPVFDAPPAPAPMPTQAPVQNSYVGPSQAAPNPYAPQPYAPYPIPPQTGGNKNMMYIVGGAVVVLLLLVVGMGTYLATRPSQPAVVIQQPVPQPQPVKVAEAKKEAPVLAQAEKKAETPTPPPAVEEKKAEETKKEEVAAKEPEAKKEPEEKKQPVKVAEVERERPVKKSFTRESSGGGEVISPKKEEKSEPVKEPSGDDDEFTKAFGGGDKGAITKKNETTDEPKKKNTTVYVPPEPGKGANVPDHLMQGQIVEVVAANKAAIIKCVQEQKAKDPSVASGTIVMRWTVQPSGKASNVSVQTDQFKSSYLGGCLGTLIKSMTFPKHKLPDDPVNFPFRF